MMQQLKWCILYFNIKTSLALKESFLLLRRAAGSFSCHPTSVFSLLSSSQDTVGYGIHPKYVLTAEDTPSYNGGSGEFFSLWLGASFIDFSFLYMSSLNDLPVSPIVEYVHTTRNGSMLNCVN